MIKLSLKELIESLHLGRIKIIVEMCNYFLTDFWELPFREEPLHIFQFHTLGDWKLEVNEKSEDHSGQSVLWLPAYQRHRLSKGRHSPEKGFFNIRAIFYLDGEEVSVEEPYILLKDSEDMLIYFELALREFRKKEFFYDKNLQQLVGILLSEIYRYLEIKRQQYPLDYYQMRKCESYIEEHLNKKLSVSELAQFVGLSHDYFSRVFRQTYGVSPKVYIKNQRLIKSTLYLREGGFKILHIARILGYQNEYLFCRQFKEYFGISPSDFRKNPHHPVQTHHLKVKGV